MIEEYFLLSEKVLSKLFRLPPKAPSYFLLKGDASERNFVRIKYYEKSQIKNSILMIYPNREDNSLKDYLDIQRLLKNHKLPVPEVFAFSIEDAVALLEDLGDQTLLQALSRHPEEIDSLYVEAIEILARMQSSLNVGKEESIAFKRKFDTEKYLYELNFFRKNYIENLLGKKIQKEHSHIFDQGFYKMSKMLAEYEPLVFTHRDYHSRNLMVKKGKIVMIDFQDARLGPPQYDLVSLLKDSYVSLEEAFVEKMINHYFIMRENCNFPVKDKVNFMRFFYICALQRNLKAIGTFAFQKVSRGREDYLQYIKPTFEYVKKNPLIKGDFAILWEVLSKYL
ncbi:MAG: hypothetical protein D6734_07835 [Candidatus Schekmanbacteria bacterium]|nr:MAG: hypothetical protein D6734_07835 [Candidatus Schekmanbacteria bacterium]